MSPSNNTEFLISPFHFLFSSVLLLFIEDCILFLISTACLVGFFALALVFILEVGLFLKFVLLFLNLYQFIFIIDISQTCPMFVTQFCGNCYRFCQIGPKKKKSNFKKNSFMSKCNLPLVRSLHFLHNPFLYFRMYLRTPD